MRILVVQESDWINRGPHTSHHLFERLSKRGHEIRVIDYEIDWPSSKDQKLISKREVIQNVHKAIVDNSIVVIRPPIIKIPILNYFSLIYTHSTEIKKQILEFKPDVIVGFGILNAKIAIHLARQNGIPFVYYLMDELNQLVPQKHFRHIAMLIESSNVKNANKVISISEKLREYTIEMGAKRENTEVIRSGVDMDHFRKADGRYVIRDKYNIDENDIVLFFMGWLYSFSGLKEVAQELSKSENCRLKLMVLGKGELWETLQDLKEQSKLDDRIIIIDWIPYEEIPDYIAAADICILPAYKIDVMRNIVPIKMYEYMAAGKPVIATDLPGLIREFGSNNGILYVSKPEETTSKALEIYWENSINTEGAKSRRFAERYDWEKLVDKFEKILSDTDGQSLVIDDKRNGGVPR
jgi:glycosyltransferase involved in cell wall biosynthesis